MVELLGRLANESSACTREAPESGRWRKCGMALLPKTRAPGDQPPTGVKVRTPAAFQTLWPTPSLAPGMKSVDMPP